MVPHVSLWPNSELSRDITDIATLRFQVYEFNQPNQLCLSTKHDLERHSHLRSQMHDKAVHSSIGRTNSIFDSPRCGVASLPDRSYLGRLTTRDRPTYTRDRRQCRCTSCSLTLPGQSSSGLVTSPRRRTRVSGVALTVFHSSHWYTLRDDG